MKWSPQQDKAALAVERWMWDPSDKQVFYLAGYAGSGKSTLANDLVSSSGRRWLFGAFTGKAAYVLRQKGCEDASTIHSLVYRPEGEESAESIAKLEQELARPGLSAAEHRELAQQIAKLRKDRRPRFSLWDESPLTKPEVAGIVVDECSMVDFKLGQDLESFGKKILVLGDPAQLPPVDGKGYFTARKPDVLLTEVHRQARESGVLRLATHIREGGSLRSFRAAGDGAELLSPATTCREDLALQALEADQVLVGLNRTRQEINRRCRELTGRSGRLPVRGDRLVCLRNERDSGLFNGSQWVVLDADCDERRIVGSLRVRAEDDDRIVNTEAWLHHFLGREEELKDMGRARSEHSEFDFGYALTVHKAQGSQWDRVLVLDQSTRLGDTEPRRWLYTAVTRAANHVAVLT